MKRQSLRMLADLFKGTVKRVTFDKIRKNQIDCQNKVDLMVCFRIGQLMKVWKRETKKTHFLVNLQYNFVDHKLQRCLKAWLKVAKQAKYNRALAM